MPDSIVLTRDELVQITGLAQPKRMTAWLSERGWVFEAPTRRGEIPKVDRAYYLARMSGQSSNTRRREGPRLDFMLRAQ